MNKKEIIEEQIKKDEEQYSRLKEQAEKDGLFNKDRETTLLKISETISRSKQHLEMIDKVLTVKNTRQDDIW